MFFDVALYTALVIFAIGVIHKIDTWFLLNVGTGDRTVPVSERFADGAKGLLAALFSPKVFTLVKVFFVDVLLQARILRDKRDRLAWVMHICLFFGFMLLLLFHALGGYISRAIDSNYQATLNPWLFLRNLGGFLVIVGLLLAVVRRALVKRAQITTTGMDVYAIVILAVIICSGFVLEGLKIASMQEFTAMVEDYGDPEDAQATNALKAYWVAEFGVVAPEVSLPVSADLMESGREAHEASCVSCHSRPQAAFVSYPFSRLLAPVATGLDRAGLRRMLWYAHILACFFGLAYLAFSKMFHVISTPVSLMVAALADEAQEPSTAATRQMIELDGCRHGGACHEECPVRRRRVERIEESGAYGPMAAFLDGKSARELGSREVGRPT